MRTLLRTSLKLETTCWTGGTNRVGGQGGYGGQASLAQGEHDPSMDAQGFIPLEDAVDGQLGHPDVEQVVALGLTKTR